MKSLNAGEFAKQFLRAAKAITHHHYVDDLHDSVDTVAEAFNLGKEVRHIHSKGGFRIRNWTSNSEAVLAALGESKDGTKISVNIAPEPTAEEVLGIWSMDQFSLYVLKYVSMDQYFHGDFHLHYYPKSPESRRFLVS